MTNSDSKTCPICCETIKAHAKKCPHCHQWQNKLNTTIMHPIFGVLMFSIPFLLIWVATGVWLERAFGHRETRDFSQFVEQIVIVESRFNYDEDGDTPSVITVGKLKNNSRFRWDDITLEVQYFDKDGILIDTAHRQRYMIPILAGNEMGFVIRSQASRTKEVYDSHRVFVRSAEDPDGSSFP